MKKLLCRFRHDWQMVSFVTPVVTKKEMGEVAMHIYDASEKLGGLKKVEFAILQANSTGYLSDESIDVLSTAGKLTKLMRNVYSVRICKRCKAVQEITITTAEANGFRNMMAFMFGKKLLTEWDVIRAVADKNARKQTTMPCSAETAAGMAKEQVPSAFKRNAKTAVVTAEDAEIAKATKDFSGATGFTKQGSVPPVSDNTK